MGVVPSALSRRVEKIRRVALDLPPLPRSSSATRSKPPTVRSLSARCLWAKASNSEPSPSSVATTKWRPCKTASRRGATNRIWMKSATASGVSAMSRAPRARDQLLVTGAAPIRSFCPASDGDGDPWSAGLLSIGKGGPVGSPRARYFEGAATSPPFPGFRFADDIDASRLTPRRRLRRRPSCGRGRAPAKVKAHLEATRAPLPCAGLGAQTEDGTGTNQLRPFSPSAALDAPCRRRSGRRLARPTGLLLAPPPPLRSRPSPIFFANADRCAA